MSNIPRGTFMQAMEKYTKSIKTFISAQGFGHYSKPNGGIPKTDLDQSVQTSLGKADTALQSFTESDPTVPAWAKASSKPSYTASEVGLGNVGNFKAVSTVASQGLSDTEKANARTNIGAGTGNGTYSKPSGGIPKSDLASAVQTSLGKADSALQSESDPTVPAWAKQSSKPSYTASEVGLGNVGNFKAVSTVASQGLSDTEKANARTNIGAGTSSFSGSYNDLSDKPTIPTKVSQLTNDSGYTANTGTVTGVKVGSTSYSPSSGVVSLPAYPTTLPASDVSSWAKQSSKPSYTASEVGLGNVGNFKAVSTVASQGLSSTEQANARANIGAGTSSFSGSYNDLSNKPTIPTKVSQLTNDAGYTTNTGTYSKPSGGIPKSDLASAVQTSLGKADSALQSHQTIKQDGITGATVNRFGTCSTAAATAAKTVSITNGAFSLEAGARVSVKFTYANTAGTPTLNVNSTGAKNIYSKGSQITSGSNLALLAGTVDFIYDGTQWHLIGNYIDTNTTYSAATTSAAGLMSADDKTKLNGIATGATANIGTVTQVKVGSSAYNPSSGVVSLPAYPTTLPASDVYSWAKASSKPSYTQDEVGDGSTYKRVTATEKSTWNNKGTYSKPSGGIPKTDLASAVQTSLGKADSALQSETDPTVPAWAKAASKPSYTASEVGLGNVGNFKAVSTVASQGLSDTEKSNARANIGAGTGNGTYSKPSGGIPKTDLASAVQTSLGKADSALQSHQTIKQDGFTGATVCRYGICGTAEATAAKTVSITTGTFSLEAGARVTVSFTYTNTAGTPTLNVNSTGDKFIYSKGSKITTGDNKSLLAGTVDFIYDGARWHLIGNYIDGLPSAPSGFTNFSTLPNSSVNVDDGGFANYGPIVFFNGIVTVPSGANKKFTLFNINFTVGETYSDNYPLPPIITMSAGIIQEGGFSVPVADSYTKTCTDCYLQVDCKIVAGSTGNFKGTLVFDASPSSQRDIGINCCYLGKKP